MGEEVLLGAAAVVGLAAAAQVVTARLHVPSIVGLLVAGLIAGPFTRLVDVDAALGDLLFPFVSLAVGIVLFEGGLLLDVRELRGRASGAVIARLLSVGVAVTWVGAAIAGVVVLGLDGRVAAVLGALLTVSGPTVVLPLLRFLKLEGEVERVLRWEGIFVDAIGAALAVIVFDAVVVGDAAPGLVIAAGRVALTLGAGLVVGLVAAALLVLVLRLHRASRAVDALLVLGVVLGAFAIGDLLRPEAGLLATTALGMVIANQRVVGVERVVEFTESLGALVTSILFVLLSARLGRDELAEALVPALVFLVVLVVVVRPLAVAASTLGTDLLRRDRVVLAAMAPRGIVAAATASVFALGFEEAGFTGVERLVPVTFLVILGASVVYGLLAAPLLRRIASGAPDRTGPATADARGSRVR